MAAYFLVYVSTARNLMTAHDLRHLLEQCRSNNVELGVTGALLYRSGTFMQVIEGDQKTVESLLWRIEGDHRHHQLEVIFDGETSERQFTDWSMAFADLSADETDLAEGFNNLLMPGSRIYGDRPTIAQRLLLSFRASLVRN